MTDEIEKAVLLLRAPACIGQNQDRAEIRQEQKQHLTRLCEEHGFTVIKSFEIVNRDLNEYKQIAEFVEAQEGHITLITEKLDRLMRNIDVFAELNKIMKSGKAMLWDATVFEKKYKVQEAIAV